MSPSYPNGRLSAPIPDLAHREGSASQQADYALIQALRKVREQGDTDMAAIESYDPDFSVRLSATSDLADADTLLEQWLSQRLNVLQATRNQLLETWKSARTQPSRP